MDGAQAEIDELRFLGSELEALYTECEKHRQWLTDSPADPQADAMRRRLAFFEKTLPLINEHILTRLTAVNRAIAESN